MSEINLQTTLGEELGKEFAEVINKLIELPDDIVAENLATFKEQAITQYTPSMVNNIRSELIRGFEINGANRATAIETIEIVKDAVTAYLDELKPSSAKRELVEAAFEPLFSVFDYVIDRYHNFDFEMNISLEENAHVPTYAHNDDAAADLYAQKDIVVPAHSIGNMIPTGVHIELPEGWIAKIWPRSSIGAKTGLRMSNSAGIIDTSYRGQLGVLYDNISDSDYMIRAGDRIAQLTVEPAYRFKPIVVPKLTETERGEGGFGSTGV